MATTFCLMPTGNAGAEWSPVPLDQWTDGRTLEVLGGVTLTALVGGCRLVLAPGVVQVVLEQI